MQSIGCSLFAFLLCRETLTPPHPSIPVSQGPGFAVLVVVVGIRQSPGRMEIMHTHPPPFCEYWVTTSSNSWVHCKGGSRSAIASSVIQRGRFENVANWWAPGRLASLRPARRLTWAGRWPAADRPVGLAHFLIFQKLQPSAFDRSGRTARRTVTTKSLHFG